MAATPSVHNRTFLSSVEVRETAFRRQLRSELTHLKEVLRRWEGTVMMRPTDQPDAKTGLIRLWIEQLEKTLQAEGDISGEVLDAALDTLQMILKDPRRRPLDEFSILGKDGHAYPSSAKKEGPLHDLVNEMVKWLHRYRSPLVEQARDVEESMVQAFAGVYARINLTFDQLEKECQNNAQKTQEEKAELRGLLVSVEQEYEKLQAEKDRLTATLQRTDQRLSVAEQEQIALQLAYNALQEKANRESEKDILFALGIVVVSALGSAALAQLGMAALPEVEGIRIGMHFSI